MMISPDEKYRAYPPVALPDRTWPEKSITKAPIWCSVDLRDGNQALIDPMGHERKARMLNAAARHGLQGNRDRLSLRLADRFRLLPLVHRKRKHSRRRDPAGAGAVPRGTDHPHLRRLRGAKSAIVHFYNSTSELQRRVVFDKDMAGIKQIAADAARLIKQHGARKRRAAIRFEYSPESFTGTELDMRWRSATR